MLEKEEERINKSVRLVLLQEIGIFWCSNGVAGGGAGGDNDDDENDNYDDMMSE